MPRHSHQKAQIFDLKIRIVKALPGGKFVEEGEFNCERFSDAKRVADRMQTEFDQDCDPCRTYVYNERDPVPIYAGLQLSSQDRNRYSLDAAIRSLINYD